MNKNGNGVNMKRRGFFALMAAVVGLPLPKYSNDKYGVQKLNTRYQGPIQPRKLKARWSVELEQDLQIYHIYPDQGFSESNPS